MQKTKNPELTFSRVCQKSGKAEYKGRQIFGFGGRGYQYSGPAALFCNDFLLTYQVGMSEWSKKQHLRWLFSFR